MLNNLLTSPQASFNWAPDLPHTRHKRSRSNMSTTTSMVAANNMQRVGSGGKKTSDYKLENAHERFQGSLDALSDYLACQAGVNPHTLQLVKESIHNDSTATREAEPSTYAQKSVQALEQFQQYADCLLSEQCCETKRLMLMTAWESLSRYLQLMQKRLERHHVQSSMLGAPQLPTTRSTHLSQRKQALNQLSEAIVSCQKEWILLQNNTHKIGMVRSDQQEKQ